MGQLIYFEDSVACDPKMVGSKAANLAKLQQHGVNVAPGLIIPTTAFDTFLRERDWLERARARDPSLKSDIAESSLLPDLVEKLQSAISTLGDCLIVRSSGVAEDGENASWAGQLDTVIGAHPGRSVEKAILRCWASAFGARALEYVSPYTGDEPRIAVLLQPIIHPECAGVMFTVNPLNGSWREMIVEAAWGQAEPVVQGELVPDSYVVRRPRKAPRPLQRILARVRLDVVDDSVRPQINKSIVDAMGLRSVPVEKQKVEAPKLRHAQLLKLCRLGLRLEGLMGAPQDVEWALTKAGDFVVLQTRPITTHVSVRRTGPALWTRRFIGERWTEPATPLGWSLVEEALGKFINYPNTQKRFLGGGDAMRLVRFAPYMNVTIFRHLAFKLPGAPPPHFMMELLPPEEKKGWVRRRAQTPDFFIYTSVLKETIVERRWRMFAANPLTNPSKWRNFSTDLEQQIPSLQRPGVNPAACMALSVRCKRLMERYIGVHICSLLWANVFYQLSESILSAQGHSGLVRDVLRPVEESWTVRTNHALWRLGRNEISRDTFLEEYGHRAASSWELFSPRWYEAPGQVDVLAEAAAQHGNPALLGREQARRAADAVGRISGPLRRLIERTQEYLLLRENQRFHFDRLLWAWKIQLLAIEDQLDMPIRFLHNAELKRLVAGSWSTTDAAHKIEQRKIAWEQEVERRRVGDEPPNFLIGSEVVGVQRSSQRLQGSGASPGVVTGTVRILRSPEEGGRLQPGDILVARATDPGWTPLFLKAGGLIVELGGLLSHGAIVAREYGLPAVANVSGATKHLKDGQQVTIDGRQGVVWLQKQM